jgi:hypothetical protein
MKMSLNEMGSTGRNVMGNNDKLTSDRESLARRDQEDR